MKKNLNLIAAALVVGVALFIASCGTTDKCEDLNCGANGVCVDGTCQCDVGYEGTDCSTLTRQKYLGAVSVAVGLCEFNDTCLKKIETLVCPTYNSNITANPSDVKKFNISNFANLVDNNNNPINLTVGATVTSPTEVKLDEINVPGQGGLKGSGVYLTNPKRLILTYQIRLNCDLTVERDTIKLPN